MRKTFLTLALGCLAWAAPLETLQEVEGVHFPGVTYQASESQADPQIEAAIANFSQVPAGEEVRYLYNRVRLHGDKDSVLVLLISSQFVGSGGATMLVLDPAPQGYRVVSRFTLTNSPILVSKGQTHGWHDLVWLVRGGGTQPHYAALKFDGKTYPSNPSSVPPVKPKSALQGRAVLADPIRPGVGLSFRR